MYRYPCERMMKTINKLLIASIDIDAQKGFTPLCPNELPVPEGHLIVDELNSNAKLANYRIASRDAHPSIADWNADTPILVRAVEEDK